MKRTLIIMTMALWANSVFSQQSLSGTVFSASDQTPIPSASLSLLRSGTIGKASMDGGFRLDVRLFPDTLSISHVGYLTLLVPINAPGDKLEIVLIEDPSVLQEVVVNTGYGHIPRERATGSFEHVDNRLLNRSVGPDILSRLDGVAGGVQFVNPNGSTANDIRVRGLSTIESDETPLIILDNFPYEGDISNINPNDVESITVLKDAAAASIWGARAGNGVIVITTKRGHYGQRASISLNTNVTVGHRPTLFYSRNRLPSSTVMEIEREIYEKGGYTLSEGTPLPAYVELLIARDGKAIGDEEFLAQESLMRKTELRRELTEHLYRNTVNQQYALNVSGGSHSYRYQISLGYDNSLGQYKGNENDRLNIRFDNGFKPWENIELVVGVRYSEQRYQNNGVGLTELSLQNHGTNNQYLGLRDDAGNALPIVKDYRWGYVGGAVTDGLLDWYYRPLDEVKLVNRKANLNELIFNSEMNWRLVKGLTFKGQYQFTKGRADGSTYSDPDSYHVRNLINRFTQDDGSRIIPQGGILRGDNPVEAASHFLRAQVNADLALWEDHQVSGLVGSEVRQSVDETYQGYMLYGFDDELYIGTNAFDYITRYPTRPRGTARIPNSDAYRRQSTDRYLSYFGNFAYRYAERYILSGSVRWDGSNLFGVKVNQRGKLLWSVGGSWELNRENFYRFEEIPSLRLRATYGSGGNVNKSVSHYPTIGIVNDLTTGAQTATINTIGNPSLRWEQVNTLNLGVDFSAKDRMLSGSVDWYTKFARDLIGNAYMPPSVGIVGVHKINYADLLTRGIDIRLSSDHLRAGNLKWGTTVLFHYVSNEITNYDTPDVNEISYYIYNTPPSIGRSRDALYALPWHGLDANNGFPVVFMDGLQTDDYTAYYRSRRPEDLSVSGVTVPTFYGSLRNDFNLGGFSLSFMLQWKSGHVFRRNSMAPAAEYNGVYHMDYFLRWQKPGDELNTNVPAKGVYGETDPMVSLVYEHSEVLVEPASHLRFQDVNLGYTLSNQQLRKLPVSSFRIFLYARNLGLLWSETKQKLDPDFANAEFFAPRSLALGLQVQF